MTDVEFKGDYDFDITPSHGYIQDAIMHAVYMPLTPSGLHYNHKLMIEMVLRWWRLRTLQLSQVGLEGFEKGLKLQYIRNCPPVACTVTQSALPCTKTRLCPFCWARDVVVPAIVSVNNSWYSDNAPMSKDSLDIYRIRHFAEFETIDDALVHARETRMQVSINAAQKAALLS